MHQTYISNVSGVIKRYRVYQRVSGASSVSMKYIGCIKKYQVYQEVSCVSRGVLGVSYVYKVYQTYISNECICDILPLDVWAELRFCHFRK